MEFIQRSENGPGFDPKLYNLHVIELLTNSVNTYLDDSPAVRELIVDDLRRELGEPGDGGNNGGEERSDRIRLNDEGTLIFGECRVDLSEKNLMRKLFSAFLENSGNRLNKEELIFLIYGRRFHECSTRRRASDIHNIVKLLSRARRLASVELGRQNGIDWDWFPYDSYCEEWMLMRPRFSSPRKLH